MKKSISWLILLQVVMMSCYNALASDDFGSVIFNDHVLAKHLNEELGPHAVGSSAIAFVAEFVKKRQSFALVIWGHISELEREGIPIQVIGVAAADFSGDQSTLREVISGAWLEHLGTGQEHQLASCEALMSVPDDRGVFRNDSSSFQKLISPNIVAMTCFIIKEGEQERLICANGFLEDHGDDDPTKRSETFAKLFELLDEVWTGDRDDYARIIEGND